MLLARLFLLLRFLQRFTEQPTTAKPCVKKYSFIRRRSRGGGAGPAGGTSAPPAVQQPNNRMSRNTDLFVGVARGRVLGLQGVQVHPLQCRPSRCAPRTRNLPSKFVQFVGFRSCCHAYFALKMHQHMPFPDYTKLGKILAPAKPSPFSTPYPIR